MKDKQIFLLTGLTIVIIIMLPYLGLLPKFAISDSDFTLESYDVYSSELNSPTVSNGTINVHALGADYSLASLASLYYISNTSTCSVNPTTIYSNIPSPDGTSRICRIQYTLLNDTFIETQTYSSIYTKEVQVQVQNITQTQYVQNISYVNVTQNKTVEVIKEVQIQPSFFERYGLAGIIFFIMGVIIIYLIYKRKK